MKYTRYEYKKTGIIKIVGSIVLVVSITVVSGFYIGNLVFKGREFPSLNNEHNEESVNAREASEVNNLNIVVVQCGCFSKKENADASLGLITKYCQPFILENDEKFRVIAGIYDEDTGNRKLQELKESGIDVAKITLNIEDNNKTKIQEIFNGFFQIINKFEENDTKSINTSKYKEWCKTVISDDDYSNDEKIKKVYDCMNDLPEELQRTDIAEIEKKLYEIVL